MRPTLCLCGLLLMLFSSGCDDATVANKPQPPAPAPEEPYQRFVPIPPPQQAVDALMALRYQYLALDTKTGKLCRTAEVKYNDDVMFNTYPLCAAL